LFYVFRFESCVPRDRLVPGVEAVLGIGAIRKSLDPYCSSTWRRFRKGHQQRSITSQIHIVTGQATRRTRQGREIIKPIWSRVPPALQLPTILQAATGRQMRRTRAGGISIKSSVAVFRL